MVTLAWGGAEFWKPLAPLLPHYHLLEELGGLGTRPLGREPSAHQLGLSLEAVRMCLGRGSRAKSGLPKTW